MRPVYPIAAAIIIIAFFISVPLFNSTKEDFSTYNTGWNGCSGLTGASVAGQHQVSIASSLSKELNGTNRGLLVMLNPSKSVPMTDEDVASVRTFVENGGTLLLANDNGNGNALLDGMGLGGTVRFNGSLLNDQASQWSGDAFPLITTFAPSNLTAGVQTLYFNYATTLDIAGTNGSVTTLASSSAASYLTQGASEQANASIVATMGAKPVLASLSYGKGTIVLCSDPSVFVNSMLDKGDNQRLFANIVGGLTSDPTAPLIFDESHRAVPLPWEALYNSVNTDTTTKYILILAVMSVVPLVAGVRRITRTRRSTSPEVVPEDSALREIPRSEESVINDMLKRHPSWDKQRVQELARIVQSVHRRQQP